MKTGRALVRRQPPTFRLSASIDPKKIKATYDLGVLTITLSKAETAKPHLIQVELTPQKALNA